jgi:hypothetical protein
LAVLVLHHLLELRQLQLFLQQAVALVKAQQVLIMLLVAEMVVLAREVQ